MSEQVITLTQAERTKFALWLFQEARSNQGMADAFRKTFGADVPAPQKMLVNSLVNEAAVMTKVAKKLEEMEEFTVKGS
jgi:hypothetical protein